MKLSLIKEFHIGSQNLLLGFGVVSYFVFGCNGFFHPVFDWIRENLIIYCLGFYVIVNIAIYFLYSRNDWEVAVRSCFIGTALGIGVIVSVVTGASYRPFGWYLIILSFFHFSEFLTTCITNPATLSLDSFLLNHSLAYWIAAVSSWVEFFLERWLVPSMKELWYVSLLGVVICIFGEGMRKAAMFTASTNFNHIVQVNKKKDHKLVTWGVYSFCRHPSYVGWFWWSLGTQIVLVNPICLVVYTVVSWFFFNNRIKFEEMTLIQFFGHQYLEYKRRVATGLPFITGYKIPENLNVK